MPLLIEESVRKGTHVLVELPEDMTVATLNDQDAQLTFCSENGLDARANEEQKEISKQLTTFNWNEKFVKEF